MKKDQDQNQTRALTVVKDDRRGSASASVANQTPADR